MAKWTWDFGDGTPTVVTTSNLQQAHAYSRVGIFTVTLIVQNSNGCSSVVFRKDVVVSANPVPAFNFGKACLPAGAVQFTDATTVPNGVLAGTSFFWKFGDGGTSVLPNPSYIYNSTGPFQATLIATTAAGCVDSVIKTVDSVYAPPQAKFASANEICLGTPMSFTDQSTAQNSLVTGWVWNFGDGSPTSSQQNPSHTYVSAGTYTVTLSVRSAVGCPSVASFSKQVVINPQPSADFTISTPQCAARLLTFTSTSVANAGTLTKWTWNFGDGTPSFSVSANSPQVHTFASTGTYDVSLQVESSKGCTSSVQKKQVNIRPVPVPGFAMPGNCINDPVTQFTDTSSIADGSQAGFTYRWNFGDGNSTPANPNTSTVKDPAHKFTATGNYPVTLVVTSAYGCADSLTQIFTLNGAVPVAAFSLVGGGQLCSNDSVRLVDNSSVLPGRLVKLEIYWDYAGDPTNKLIVQNPVAGKSYNYRYPEFFAPATKTYRIKFVSYSGINCLSEKDTVLTIKATPDIDFPAVPAVCADSTPFQLLASVRNMTAGRGTFSGRGVSAFGLFDARMAGAGKHPIRFTYEGTNGCTNFKEQIITVYPVPTVNAGPDRFVLDGGSATIAASASGNGLQYLWSPATYLNSATILQPLTMPADDIQYTLRIRSADGCVASDDVFVKLLKTPDIPNVFTPNGDGANDRWAIQYLESYPGATVEVFNRYGSLIFRSTGYTKPWDGTYNGRPVPAGTYYYIINPKNGRKSIAGFVDVVR